MIIFLNLLHAIVFSVASIMFVFVAIVSALYMKSEGVTLAWTAVLVTSTLAAALVVVYLVSLLHTLRRRSVARRAGAAATGTVMECTWQSNVRAYAVTAAVLQGDTSRVLSDKWMWKSFFGSALPAKGDSVTLLIDPKDPGNFVFQSFTPRTFEA